jgi:hypothetical protein
MGEQQRAAMQAAIKLLEVQDRLGRPAPSAAREVITALRAALTQQEQDWESRAEIAEQQVVSLSEELEHCKGLLRKQQEQDEPVALAKEEACSK